MTFPADRVVAEESLPERWRKRVKHWLRISGADRGLVGFVDVYLSDLHIANRGQGCAVASLSGDVSRSSARRRELYGIEFTRYVERLIEITGNRLTTNEASGILTALAGAVAVVRSVTDEAVAPPYFKGPENSSLRCQRVCGAKHQLPVARRGGGESHRHNNRRAELYLDRSSINLRFACRRRTRRSRGRPPLRHFRLGRLSRC